MESVSYYCCAAEKQKTERRPGRDELTQSLSIGSGRWWSGGGNGTGGLSLESRVKFPYIHKLRNFLEQLLVTVNV